jgi:hypothetical protein
MLLVCVYECMISSTLFLPECCFLLLVTEMLSRPQRQAERPEEKIVYVDVPVEKVVERVIEKPVYIDQEKIVEVSFTLNAVTNPELETLNP